MTSDESAGGSRTVEVSIDSGGSEAYVIDVGRIERLVRFILDLEAIEWCHVGVVFSNHELVTSLNRSYLNHDFETDVLSFLVDTSVNGIEGEVYVDVETAMERHGEFSASLSQELERYVAHGVLHLAGYDDSSEGEREQMHCLENRYMGLLD